MAKAGFFATSSDPSSDCVRCFCCFKDLENWDDDDDPWTEHRKRNKCLFAKLAKQQSELTAGQFSQILEERLKNLTVSPLAARNVSCSSATPAVSLLSLQEKRRQSLQSVKTMLEEVAGDD